MDAVMWRTRRRQNSKKRGCRVSLGTVLLMDLLMGTGRSSSGLHIYLYIITTSHFLIISWLTPVGRHQRLWCGGRSQLWEAVPICVETIFSLIFTLRMHYVFPFPTCGFLSRAWPTSVISGWLPLLVVGNIETLFELCSLLLPCPRGIWIFLQWRIGPGILIHILVVSSVGLLSPLISPRWKRPWWCCCVVNLYVAAWRRRLGDWGISLNFWVMEYTVSWFMSDTNHLQARNLPYSYPVCIWFDSHTRLLTY